MRCYTLRRWARLHCNPVLYLPVISLSSRPLPATPTSIVGSTICSLFSPGGRSRARGHFMHISLDPCYTPFKWNEIAGMADIWYRDMFELPFLGRDELHGTAGMMD